MASFNRGRASRCSLLLSLVLLWGCAHGANQETQNKAQGHYRVALTLVHEAGEKLAANEPAQVTFKYRRALSEIKSALEFDENNADIHYLASTIYFLGFREHEWAIKHGQHAIEVRRQNDKKNFPEAQNLLGSILIDAGRPAEAIVYLKKARADLLYVTPYFADKELGVAHLKLGEAAKAITYFERALSGHADLCGAYINLIEAYELEQRHDRALHTADRFVETCDTDRLRASCGPALLSAGYYRRGMSYLKLGQRDAAIDSFRICTERFSGEAVSDRCLQNFNRLIRGAGS